MREKRLPDTVLICGIQYRVQEHEGLISFVEVGGISGCRNQFTFERDGDGMCWYLTASCSFGKIMVSHVLEAYNLVTKVYGKNFETIPAPE
jgi:hypothetical protein